jgi:hypothetical protein
MANNMRFSSGDKHRVLVDFFAEKLTKEEVVMRNKKFYERIAGTKANNGGRRVRVKSEKGEWLFPDVMRDHVSPRKLLQWHSLHQYIVHADLEIRSD